MKKYVFLTVGAIFIAVCIGLVAQKINSPEGITGQSLLSLVISSEMRTLKQWQDHGALQVNMSVGSRGDDVRVLQLFLTNKSPQLFLSENVTGYYGPITKNAVSTYQSRNNLPNTGVTGPQTRAFINTALLQQACPESDDAPLPLTTKITRKSGIASGYVPPGLKTIDSKITGGKIICLEENTAAALMRMSDAASKEGYTFQITSGYRHPMVQQIILDFWLRLQGVQAYNEVALPGHSEHQLGTTIDLTVESIAFAPVVEAIDETKEWKWLVENAPQYGFIMSYPKGAEAETGYIYEPWHWKYVGEEALTLSEQ
jgi:LAS superfamily LD-carboxypeptidase LdcB